LRELKAVDKIAYGELILSIAGRVSHALVDKKMTVPELKNIIEAFYNSNVKTQKAAA